MLQWCLQSFRLRVSFESWGMQDHEHPHPTRRSQLRYLFTAKHHGGGSTTDARWSVTEDEEFSVFDEADFRDIGDEDGRLYGVLGDAQRELRELGNSKSPSFQLRRQVNPGMAIRFGLLANSVRRTAEGSNTGRRVPCSTRC